MPKADNNNKNDATEIAIDDSCQIQLSKPEKVTVELVEENRKILEADNNNKNDATTIANDDSCQIQLSKPEKVTVEFVEENRKILEVDNNNKNDATTVAINDSCQIQLSKPEKVTDELVEKNRKILEADNNNKNDTTTIAIDDSCQIQLSKPEKVTQEFVEKYRKILEDDDNNKNNATTIAIDDSCQIQLPKPDNVIGELVEEDRKSQLCIEFNDLSYSIYRKKIKKPILRDVTGHFEAGKLTVIIGPSGAGKTTLLKIISGERWVNVDGTVSVNGIEQNKGMFRKHVCYVPQQFELLPFLTTRETLYIAARLKLDVKRNEKANARLIVNEIAESLGLSDCLDTLTNKLSGGERKRLSIGVEMITKPSVFLLDEPTSGLDSAASNQLINVLHNMAKANCTVVCAIHQPSSQMISQFDDIMVLDRGRCMYCGPKSEILNTYELAGFTCPHFYNIAEFVLEVITEQRDGNLNNLYKICCSEYKKNKSLNEHSKNEMDSKMTCSKQNIKNDNIDNFLTSTNTKKQKLSTWQQQKILFSRALICIKRDTTMTMLRLTAHVVVGLLLGAVFYDFGNDAQKVNSNIACLFFLLLFLFFANSMPAVQMFPTEAAVFLQEHLNNWYSLRAYYSVKILTDLPMQILCSSSFLLLSYYLTGQPMESDRVLRAWSIGVLITILGQTVGILTGAAFNTEIGVFLIPALSIPLLLFAGFFLKIEEMSAYLRPLSSISFFRYAFEGMMQAIYGFDRPELHCANVNCYFSSPSIILSQMGIPSVPFYVTLIILGCWIFLLHFTVYVVVCWKIYYSRK